jgi:hypothetical protein
MRVALIEPFHTRLEADERAASLRRRYGWLVSVRLELGAGWVVTARRQRG